MSWSYLADLSTHNLVPKQVKKQQVKALALHDLWASFVSLAFEPRLKLFFCLLDQQIKRQCKHKRQLSMKKYVKVFGKKKLQYENILQKSWFYVVSFFATLQSHG